MVANKGFTSHDVNLLIIVIEPSSGVPTGINPSRLYSSRTGFDSDTLKLTAGKRLLAASSETPSA